VEEGPAGEGRLFWRYRLTRANTIINTDGVYTSVRTPGIEELEAATAFYQGGHKIEISDSERTSLTNAGFGAYITEE
jgi:hypothetical protein